MVPPSLLQTVNACGWFSSKYLPHKQGFQEASCHLPADGVGGIAAACQDQVLATVNKVKDALAGDVATKACGTKIFTKGHRRSSEL